MLVVTLGSTSVKVLKATSTASAGLVPSTRNTSTRCLMPPTRMHKPTTPLQTIMMAANTVSRASAAVALLVAVLRVAAPGCRSASISETISATSITVTATASTRVP